MTTKTLTGAVVGGYSLAAYYSELIITASGSVSGAGGPNQTGAGDGGAGGSGVYIAPIPAGRTVVNGGAISGGAGGYGFNGGAGGAGLSLGGGGSLSNTGAITGGAGGPGNGGVVGAGGAAVLLASGGNLANTGVVTGGAGGGAGGAGGDGVAMTAGGSLTNGSAGSATALISGSLGVDAGAGGTATVTNYGTIQGTGGTSVQFASSGDRLIDEAGSTFIGTVQGSRGTLELAAGSGEISGLGTAFSGFGAYALDAGGAWTLTGANTLGTGLALTDQGTLSVAGTLTNFGAITGTSDGVSMAAGGLLTNGSAGAISGYFDGVYSSGGACGIYNSGTILGTFLNGVDLTAGGGVANGGALSTEALIQGSYAGIYALYQAATVTNHGTIRGTHAEGVLLYAGGQITNGGPTTTNALISGYFDGVFTSGVAATVSNYGTIQGSYLSGVVLAPGGYLNNGSSAAPQALISGMTVGVQATNGATVTNLGTIMSANFAGVVMVASGAVMNGANSEKKALISGDIGVYGYKGGAVTVTNFGVIQGTAGTSIQFKSSMDRLIDQAGSTFIGAVQGGGGTLELATGTGTITGLGATGTVSGAGAGAMTFSGFGNYVLDAGSSWTLTGTNTLERSHTLTSQGALAVAGSFTNLGVIAGTAEGVAMPTGGVLANGSAGVLKALISGAVGIYAGAGSAVTVTNFGTVQGTAGTSIQFKSAMDRLIDQAGSTFIGAVQGGGGALELAAGSGVIAGLGSAFSSFGAYVLDAKGSWTLSGINTLAAGANLADAGTLTNAGAFTLAGAVSGTGTLSLADGTTMIEAGAALTVSHWSLSGGTASLSESLAYAGAFTESADVTMTVGSGDRFTLSRAAVLGGMLNGAGTVAVANVALGGLTVGGTTLLDVTGAATQTGTVTIGDTTASAAALNIAKGANYTIGGAFAIARGTAATSSLKVTGTLTRSGAAGVSVIGLKTTDAGSILAAAGTLDFAAAVTGTGSVTVDAGATLEADLTVASTLLATFAGGDAVVALKDPAQFAANLAGFGPTDTIELLGKKATSAVLNGGDQLVITNAGKAIATLQLTGDYTGDTFLATYDKSSGDTAITVTAATHAAPTAMNAPAAPHAFIAAMAAMGAAAGSALTSAGTSADAWRSVLSAPRTQSA